MHFPDLEKIVPTIPDHISVDVCSAAGGAWSLSLNLALYRMKTFCFAKVNMKKAFLLFFPGH